MPELDADKIVENIEQFGHADGDPDAAPTVENVEQPEVKEESQVEGFSFKTPDELMAHKLKYSASGKEIEEDIQTILTRASKGYHYAQQMEALKKEREEFSPQIEEAKRLNEKWSQYEDYAKQNPEWYDHWQSAWNNRHTRNSEGMFDSDQANYQAMIDAKVAEKLKPYEERLRELGDFTQTSKIKEEDSKLESEINSIRSQYKDIDFDRTDPETGMSLEYQVLKFGSEHGIRSYEQAFKAFYHDKLVERQVALKEKEKIELEKQKRSQGIISESSSPHVNGKPVNLRNKNWEQVTDMALADLEAGKF